MKAARLLFALVFCLCVIVTTLLATAAITPAVAEGTDRPDGVRPNTLQPDEARQDATPKRKRAKSLIGSPVNVNMASSGTLPKDVLLTMVNASFSDKTHSKKGGTADTFSQVWLGKVRYGLTNYWEVGVVVPYINNERRNYGGKGPKHIEGFGDVTLQLTWSPYNQHQGDPLNLSFGAAVLFPTGNYGKNHLSGNGAWGGRAVAAVGKFFTPNFRMDTEVAWTGPFERGNQHVKRGNQYLWNTQARYLFDWVDIGFESTVVKQESGDKSTDFGTVNLHNGSTEWYVGPSMNFAVDSLAMWVGAGVYFPLVQDVKGPANVDNVRFEFKIGKLW